MVTPARLVMVISAKSPSGISVFIKKNQLINLQTTQKIPPKHQGPF